MNTSTASAYRGRFAPSPSGSLHFGSLIAATASYLDAKANQGSWLLRIEDVDTPRVRKDAIPQIIHSLEAHGFQWDESILYQSERLSAYEAITQKLLKDGLAYYCSCSRKFLKRTAELGACGFIYPNTCRDGLGNPESSVRSVRVITDDKTIDVDDRLQDRHVQRLESEIGDFVIKRTDGVFTYQLAVVIDDEFQQITDVVRGYDLLDNTARQIHLQTLLGYAKLNYLHFPLALGNDGNKLSKQNHSPEINTDDALFNIHQSLQFLGQNPPTLNHFEKLADLWEWAIMHWNIKPIPKQGKTVDVST